MNNKKLFKGALVLFASILMAVSCQSNSNPNDNNDSNNNNNNNNTKSDVAIIVPEVVLASKTTTSVIIGKFDSTAQITAKAEITLTGDDLKNLADEGEDKIIPSVGTVTVIGKDPTNTDIPDKGNWTDLTSKGGAKTALEAKGAVTVKVNSNKLEISLSDTARDIVFATGNDIFTATKDYGMISFPLTFTDKSGKKNAITKTVYIVIQRKDA